jgi:Fe-S oxidoreductase
MNPLEQRRKQMADCAHCNNCKWTPVVKSDRFASICPSYDFGKYHQYTGGGKLINGYGLLKNVVAPTPVLTETIYTCSMCGGCDVACKTNFGDLIEPLDSLYAIREHIVASGALPPVLKIVLRNIREHGNADGHPARNRDAWHLGLNVRSSAKAGAKVLLHTGNGAFDQSQWPALQRIVAQLNDKRVDFAAGGADEPDTGSLAFALGDRSLARTLAEKTAQWIRNSGATQLIVCSDEAYAAFRGIYPRLGVSLDAVEVLHITQWLAAQQKPAAPTVDSAAAGEKVTYHDSCHLGRLSEPYEGDDFGPWQFVYNSIPARKPETAVRFGDRGLYDAPRQLLQAPGTQIVEMERSREYSYCCGAGGGGQYANPDFAQFAGRERLEEAIATGAGTLVTSCNGCTSHLTGIARRHGLPIKVVNLVDYLATRETAQDLITPQGAE